ncbi:carboxymuconolactone decarboxylase family protein [Pseudomonas glycinae]|uniref:carboxymuconolactone decarboxylase family protein n=1 Tax=Pseudomonas glycinae TaxID=1785145 RepID=UPI00169FD613|nr:carboxymuconolactone decarboxylase family protein [Pseudomonas glycinae]NKF26496.1 carboxymuconolactone decarboxylase family protein [Pseudomonas sp. BG5]
MNQKTTSDPMATLYQEGRHTFVELVPDGGARLDALFHTVPALGQLAVGVVYGHLHSRPGLDPRLREAVSLAAIVASGMFGPPLSVHLKTGLASGLAPGELTEILLQASAFAGFPRAVSAAEQLNHLFADAGLESPPPPTPREVTSRFCADVRAGHPPIPLSAAVKRQLRQADRLALQACTAQAVIVECFQSPETQPKALLYATVVDDTVVAVKLFKAQ